jgi:hypothetical protein
MTDKQTPAPAPILAGDQGASQERPGSHASHDAPAGHRPLGVDPSRTLWQASRLWALLDDIDTLDDACRDDDRAFRFHVRRIQKKRFDIMTGKEWDAASAMAARSGETQGGSTEGNSAVGRKPETPEERVAGIKLCYEPDCSGVWCPCRETIANALRTSRNEALQEAAVIARDYDEDHANRAVMRNTATTIFERIRALKEPTP